MDSPLLPTIRGGPRDLDDSFADMSLVSAQSPDPPSSNYLRAAPTPTHAQGGGSSSDQRNGSAGQQQVKGSVFGRPPPTRYIDETPEPPRSISSFPATGSSRTSSTGAGPTTGPYGSSTLAAGGSGGGGGRQKPRQSIFPPLNSSLRGSSNAPRDRPQHSSGQTRPANKDDGDDVQGDEGDITILPSSSTSRDEEGDADAQTEAGAESKRQDEDDGLTSEARMKRDERLKDSLYELRGMNDTFEVFLNALESARGHNERLALRVKETSTLLDQYTALLGQTEHTQRLLSNPNWTGADDDLRVLEADQAAKEAAELEASRIAEETARREEDERQRRAAAQGAARAKEATRGGARGRGIPSRGGVTRGRGSGILAPSTRSVSAGKPPPTVRQAPSGLGLAGQYANVKSSGYGPSRKAT